jgi:hypothetical protein
MKQLLLILGSLFFGLQLTAQENTIYTLNENGNLQSAIQVAENSDGITIDLILGSFTGQQVVADGITANRILLEDGISIMEQGQPDIQYLASSIAIPFTGKTFPVITAAEYTDYSSFNIAPSTGDPGIYGLVANKFIYDTTIYNANTFYPAQIIKANDPYIFSGSRGQSVHFFPVQYNPVTKVLRVYTHITVSMQFVNEPGVNELVRFSPLVGSAQKQLVNAHFANQASNVSNRYVALEEQGNMLVIAHPQFMESMKPFVDWKNQKGISCEMVDVTTIGDATQIREFVSEYYYSKGLTYLMLAGDEAYIPSNQAVKGLSDNVYGYIAGDDHYPEIFVGRFSCETAAQCNTMVERTIQYEKNPSATGNFSNFLGIGSGLGPGDDNELDFQHIRNVGTSIANKPYSNILEMYDGSRGGADKDGNPTASMVSNAINSGLGAIMYLGHGSVNSWVTSNFSVDEARELTNVDAHPFIWSAGCDNGGFEGTTCFAEVLLRAESNGKPAGAIAALMSSANQTWYPPMEAQDEMAMIISGQKEGNTSTTFGGISMSGCMRMNDKYGTGAFIITDNWILFGDPSVEMRSKSSMIYSPKHTIIIGSDATSIRVSGIEANSVVAISHKGTFIASVKATGDEVVVNLPMLTGFEKLTLTITGRNYTAYIADIEVTNTPSTAINQVPGNHNNKVSVTPDLSWELSEGVTPQTYTVCLREKGAFTWVTFNAASPESLSLPTLNYLTTYEWKVVSNTASASAESKVFNFTTIDRPDEDFEQAGFPRHNWVNTHEWYVDNSESFEGSFSLHSGSTESRSVSSLFYECETVACDNISFEIKVNAASEGTSVGFYMDNFLIAEWDYTIGWTNLTYQIEPGSHVFEWRFTSGDTTNNESAAWLDNIYLPVNAALVVEYSPETTCPVNAVQLSAEVSNHASLKWNTTGTGTFDDATRMDAIYFPSALDLQAEVIVLTLDVTANSTCGFETYNYEIPVNHLPVLRDYSDTTIYLNESFTVEAGVGYESMFILYGNDTIPASPVIDAARLVPGSNNITVIATNQSGCNTVKQFAINVIGTGRPETAVLTVYPNPSTDMITINNPVSSGVSVVSIFSSEGQLIEQHTFDNINAGKLLVSHLNPGLYIVRSESNGNAVTGRFIKI